MGGQADKVSEAVAAGWQGELDFAGAIRLALAGLVADKETTTLPASAWKLRSWTAARKAAAAPAGPSAGSRTQTSWHCWLRRTEMDKRIFGIETEFGISYSSPESRPLAPEEVARYLFRKVVSWGRSSNVFLTNGSRLYLDVGSHPEYATAECDDLAQLIAHDRAGELIL